MKFKGNICILNKEFYHKIQVKGNQFKYVTNDNFFISDFKKSELKKDLIDLNKNII